MAQQTLTARQRESPRDHRAAHARAGLPAVGARDRRGRRASPRPPPSTPTSPRCRGAATSGATPPSPAPSRSGGTRRPTPSSTGARSATCPLVGDVAAGTDVLAQENVEEVLPLPADFTGEGDLFMLRVRGDSMIEAGILDGDFVVCRSQTTADDGDIVVAGIPGDEATVKTFTTDGDRGRAAARQPPARADGLRRRRGAGVRPGRHRDAPPLSGRGVSYGPTPLVHGAGRTCSSDAVRSSRGSACTTSSDARSTRSSRVWASVESPGPKLAAGMPAAAKRLTSVQPSLARTSQVVAVAQRRQQRVVQRRRRGGGHVDHLDVVARPRRTAPAPRSTWACGLVGRAVGGEAVVDRHHGPVGHDVAGDPALDEHRLQRLAELAAVEHRPAALVGVERAPAACRRGAWRCGPSTAGPCGPGAPRSVTATPHRSLAPDLERAVGGLAQQRHVARHEVGSLARTGGAGRCAPPRPPRRRRRPR